MLIAQALGEYVALSGLIDAFNSASIRMEETVGDWGTEGLVVLVISIVFWKVLTGFRR
jgi:hypothetical protein